MTPAGLRRGLAERTLGTTLVQRPLCRFTSHRLRVLAYHDVPDARAFRRQLDVLRREFTPVSGAEVAAALHGGPPLPPRSVWLTFDDGRPDVVDKALPALVDAAAPATLFVCPGLIPRGSRFWQREVTDALRSLDGYELDGRRYVDRDLVVALKSVPDERRRRVVDELQQLAAPTAHPSSEDAVDVEQLHRWLDAGMEVGNHTWDHPCLDQCTPDEQRRQITTAHDALTELIGGRPTIFAYPNGDWTAEAEAVLSELGYELALLFDHRLTSTATDPLRVSRLRLDSDASIERTRAVVSGAHSAVFHAGRRLRGGSTVAP